MTGDSGIEAGGRNLWRIAAWSLAAVLLLLPLLAMQFSDEVHWTVADFAFAAGLMLAVGGSFELALKRTGSRSYRAAAAVALAAAFLLLWLSFGVGLIGADGDPANLMYLGVLAIGIGGAVVVRFQPRGMAYVMIAAALAQASVAATALLAGLGVPYSGALELIALNGFFVVLLLASAWLFRQAKREQAAA